MNFHSSQLPLPFQDLPEPPTRVLAASLSLSLGSASAFWSRPVAFELKECCSAPREDCKRKGSLPLLAVGSVGKRLHDHWLETFKEIDVQNRGKISGEDLRLFADRNGMPTDYVNSFVDAVLASSGKSRAGDLDFEAFQTYVSSRECALRRAFQLFDLDQDGKISANDLEYSLAHVRVKCPTSRCVYQSRRQAVQNLLAKVDLDGNQTVEFSEFRRFFMLLPSKGMAVDYWISAECRGRCDVGGVVVVHDERSKGSPWGHLFAGALAGAVSRTASAPLETLRLSAMTGAIPADHGTIAAAKAVVRKHGWKALYKGNFTNVLRSAPQKALDFFVFDALKMTFQGGANRLSPLETLAAAGLAGGVSNIILYPLDVVRSRLTVDSAGVYKGVGDALSKIVKSEGVPALYKGVGPSVAAILPEAAIVYGLFDLLKGSYARLTGKEPGILHSLSFGTFSAFMGQVVAYPLETVSRRMQVCGLTESSRTHTFQSTLMDVLKEGGPLALYRGLGAASLKVIPMAIVSFGTYEMVRLWINVLEENLDEIQAKQELHLCGNKVA